MAKGKLFAPLTQDEQNAEPDENNPERPTYPVEVSAQSSLRPHKREQIGDAISAVSSFVSSIISSKNPRSPRGFLFPRA